MIEFVPFRAAHLQYLTPQAAQRADHEAALQSNEGHLLEGHTSLTAWAGSTCLGMAGLIPVYSQRAAAWLLLSDSAARYMLPITRKVRRVIALSPYRRVELSVREGFTAGHQFARLIGAKCETPEPMRQFGPRGESEMLYAIVKEG